ncbi:hypothetical protein D6853_00605 [Butyrivibrio sp. X503]|uniref:hypothetical protein n=1 Tax=Butyrivibrio sp. X503 TaxID=2364878 RepID=UPI000EAA0101|nr:hypothetical protein [Butyrivibrio sp. X503]RKM58070.1 hypothetical protein D6853_00605 [Butyrivibrio sp. X503]
MNNLLFVTGCAWIIWALSKWKVFNFIWENKVIKVFGCILGAYNMFLAFFAKRPMGELLLFIDFVLVFALDIYFFMIRLKKGQKGIMKIYQLVLGSIFIITALWMLWPDHRRIYVGVATLTGAMMMITAPFQEGIEKLNKEKA